MLISPTALPPSIPRGWAIRKLKELVITAGDGGTPPRDNPNNFGGSIPWVVITDVCPRITFTAETITPAGLRASNAKLWPEGAVVLTTGATIGEVGIAAVPLATKQGITGIICDRSQVTPAFLATLFKRGKNLLLRFSQGSTFKEIRPPTLLALQALVPPVNEQHRIAEILDTLDETIRKTEQLITKLQQAKQGLLHDLLTRGVDDNGELRDPERDPGQFKDSVLGRIPKDWDVVNLSAIANNLDGQRIPIKSAVRRRGDYPYYGASGVIDWVDSYIFDGDYVLLGEDGENVVSRHLPLAFRATGKIWVNNHAHIYEPLPGVDIRFLVALLESKDYGPWVSGSAQPKLTQDALNRLLFVVPPAIEQSLIADRIDAQHSVMDTEALGLEKLRTLKKGLMDDLLTGRVRVPTEA